LVELLQSPALGDGPSQHIDEVGWVVMDVVPIDDDPDAAVSFACTVGLTAHFTDRPLCDQVVRAGTS
jgi:hypothetical protein